MTDVVLRTLTCRQCGMDWQRPRVRGNPPVRCPDCRQVPTVPKPRKPSGPKLDTNRAGYRIALAVTTYRLAIEEAASALRLGRNAEALAALERVAAPARSMKMHRRYTPKATPRVIELPD